MKILDFAKKVYERLKLKNIAIASVLITQALKRVVQSEIGLLILDLAPIPWVNLIGKIFGWIGKANSVIPIVVREISIAKGLIGEIKQIDYKSEMDGLVQHLRVYSKEELNDFLAFFSLQIMNASAGDGIIDHEEKKQILEDSYKFLFKTKR